MRLVPFRLSRRRERGQSLVEFALIMTPLMLMLLAIVQFGFIFNTYVTITNATREAARTGTIVLYDSSLSKAQNDLARNEAIRASLLTSMNLLSKTSPQFANSGTWTQSGETFTSGDLVVTYELPAGVPATDARTGQRVTIKATYHQDLVIPLIANLLPRDASGRRGLGAEVTMVIN